MRVVFRPWWVLDGAEISGKLADEALEIRTGGHFAGVHRKGSPRWAAGSYVRDAPASAGV